MKFSAKLARSLIIISSCTLAVAANAQTKKGKKKAAPAAAPAASDASAPVSEPAATAGGSASSAEAANATSKAHRAPYGMAGCGLGSLIVKTNSKGPQIGAAFLNATGYQTFGISSGTSNCKLSKDDIAKVEQEVFMEVNLASLAKDAAQGQGEHLSAFAEILGCGQGESLSLFNDLSRSNYDAIFQGQDSKVVLSNYKSVIKSNETLAKSCVRA